LVRNASSAACRAALSASIVAGSPRHGEQIAVQRLRHHAHLAPERVAIVMIEAARDQIRPYLEQRPPDDVRAAPPAVPLQPLVPASDDELGVGDHHALRGQCVEPAEDGAIERGRNAGVGHRAGPSCSCQISMACTKRSSEPTLRTMMRELRTVSERSHRLA